MYFENRYHDAAAADDDESNNSFQFFILTC
jgi:hypothetical protein